VRRAGGVALVCAVGLVAGCGGAASAPPAKTLSHGRFVYLAARACARAHRQAAAIGQPTNLQTFVRGLRKAIPQLDDRVAHLRTLTPPPGDAVAFRRMVTNFDKAEFAAHRLLDALDAHEFRLAKTLLRRLERFDKRLNRRSRNLGLRACAKPPAAWLPPAVTAKLVDTSGPKNGLEFTINGQRWRIVVTHTQTTVVPVK
jgi:hypothetical protein